MHKDDFGIFFQADACGEFRFKSASAAQAAYDEERRQRELQERAKALAKANRVEMDIAMGEARLFRDGRSIRTQPIDDKRQARLIIFDLVEEVEATDVIWI